MPHFACPLGQRRQHCIAVGNGFISRQLQTASQMFRRMNRLPFQGSQSPERQGTDHSSMPGMDMDDAKTNEAHAVHDMTRGHHDAHNLHMRMTAMRPASPQDTARANEVVTQLRGGLEKYKDYH